MDARVCLLLTMVGGLLLGRAVLATEVTPVSNAKDGTLAAQYEAFALQHSGNAAAGQILFERHERLACAKCHRILGDEKSGPNLDGIADKFPRADLIKHVLYPSAAIKSGFEQMQVLTEDGQLVVGRLERSNREMLRLINAEGKRITIKQGDVAESDELPKSLMPEGLPTQVTPQDFADLIAYLETLRSAVFTGVTRGNTPIEVPVSRSRINFRPLLPNDQKFRNPVYLAGIPGFPDEVVVLEHQEAKIWRLTLGNSTPRKTLFADLEGQVKYGNNWGLMCIAFHPDYARNGRYFLEHEVAEGKAVLTTVVERQATPNRLADTGRPSRRLLWVEQPAFNHNGGCIAFGPDGMLYAAFGDGGPQKDPNGYAQNPRIFHGSMLRVDVDHRVGSDPYAIPRDNPFLSATARDPTIRAETFAIGFREPWRFSFDAETGDLWVGDVGQDLFEEVAIVRAGENHGWNILEGWAPFSDEFRRPDAQFAEPVFAYPHSLGVSVTGGYVYRGSRSETFRGVYLFGDYETRRVWGLRQEQGRVTEIYDVGHCPDHIASFGTDNAGEIYVIGYEGQIYHLDLSEARFGP